MLRCYQEEAQIPDVATAYKAIDGIIKSCQRAIRTAGHSTIGVSPGAQVFRRDMLLNVPVLVDLETIRANQAVADKNNLTENRQRRYKNYQVGDEVLIITPLPTKMQERASGPYTIVNVHVNGTVTIERRPNVYERLSIRRIKPYIRGDWLTTTLLSDYSFWRRRKVQYVRPSACPYIPFCWVESYRIDGIELSLYKYLYRLANRSVGSVVLCWILLHYTVCVVV